MFPQRSYDDIRPQHGPNVRARYPDDETPLIDAIRGTLHSLQGTDVAALDLSIEGGRVQIDGSVADEGDRDRIVRAVSDVPGVIAVIDTIRIRAH